MSSEDKIPNEPQEGGGRALVHERQKVKRLEDSLTRKERENEKLRKENERLKKRNEDLKRQLDSARKKPKWVKASKPADGLNAAGRKKGPKKGHSPNIRKCPDKADREVTLTAAACSCCGDSLPPPSSWHCHWQVDIPKSTPKITTKFSVGWSWCKKCNRLIAPKERLKAAKYGPILHATIAYWKYGLGLTLGKIRTLLIAQYDLEISTGVISGILTRTSSWLEDTYEEIKTSLGEQSHLHADETGWRQDGRNFWLWSFTNDYLSFCTIEKSRSQEVVKRVLGETFDGVLITDFYGSYNAIDCVKQRCWVHLLRELRELKEKYQGDNEIIKFSAGNGIVFAIDDDRCLKIIGRRKPSCLGGLHSFCKYSPVMLMAEHRDERRGINNHLGNPSLP